MRRDNRCDNGTVGRAAVGRDDQLAAAHAAVELGDWERALTLLDEAGPSSGTAEGLALRARAAYAAGRFEESVSAWEEQYELLLAGADRTGAARAAATIAMYLMMDSGLMAPVRGWLRRAERLLDAEAPAHALIALTRTYERLLSGDVDGASRQASLAIELGERLDVPAAVVIGRVADARVRILGGDVEAGLELLDEIATLLMSGAVDPLTTGMMYCELICAAQGLALHDRAAEWTEMMQRWRPGVAVGGINGRCRVHRAERLRMTGPCDQAEEEALAACEELRPWMRREFGWPLVELGTIRLRKGDLAGAEEAFVAAHQHVWSPHPGLALVRLEQGDVDSAAALIAEEISHPLDIPSKERPPFGDLRLAPLLDAQVRIACATGDNETARAAATALGAIAAKYHSAGLDAVAVLAAARVALLDGDIDDAIVASTRAVAAWAAMDAPFEAGVARMLLGDAYRAAGNHDAARLEYSTCRDVFASFGAHRWHALAARRMDAPADPRVGGTPVRAPNATFRCEGDTRTVGYAGRTSIVRELKGFRYLERMIREPGREFHVLDLAAAEHGSLPTHRSSHVDGVAGSGLPVIDKAARDAYRRRLADVEEEISDATTVNDLGRVALAERDRDFLVAELRRAVGLGGRHRTVGSTAERARTSVTRALRYALARLADHHPPLAAHLDRCVRTGTYCSYAPDPLAPVEWHT